MTNKEKHSIEINSPEWKSKRIEILKRDGRKCRHCGSKERLHVHHCIYLFGKKLWEVPNKYLITLCENCHNKVHKNKPISDFNYIKDEKTGKISKYIKPTKKTNKKIKPKKVKGLDKREQLYLTLSEKDLKIQRLYDKIKHKKTTN